MKTTLRILPFLFLMIVGLTQTGHGQQCNAKYATVLYTQNFESWVILCGNDISSPDSSWINSNDSVISNGSEPAWRRDDYSLWGGAGSFYTPSAEQGSYSARFHTAGTAAGSYPDSGQLDLHLNCSTVNGTKQLSFYYINEGGGDYMDVSLSTDSGTTFNEVGVYTSNSGWTQYTIPIVSNSPKTIIRFSGVSAYGNNGGSDIGLDSVQVLAPCNGKPTAGTIIQTLAFCPVLTNALSLTGSTQALGLTYTWQKSNDNTNWSTVSGDTLPSIGLSITSPTYYRAIVTCTGSGLADTTASLLASGNTGSFYRKIPYTQDFESWYNNCDSLDVPDSGWINNPSTGDYSWRRDDQGTSANWDDPTVGLWYPPYNSNGTEAYHGNHSAAFNDYDACGQVASNTGALNLYIDCSNPTGTKQLSFYYINPENGDQLDIYVSTDGGVTFGSSLLTIDTPTTSNNWAHITLPINSNSATTVISFVVTADCGYYDMGLDYVQVQVPCEGKPVAGNIVASQSCFGATYSLTLSGSTSATGLSYTWQQSVDDIHWSNAVGDSTPSINVSTTISTYYRAIVICNGSSLSDTTAGVRVGSSSAFYRKMPYVQNFESWISTCNVLNVPDTGWVSNPLAGDNSWRRDDQGDSANWDNPGVGAYYPASDQGSHSARFHSSNTSGSGDLDLYLNCSNALPIQQLKFDYINIDGNDSMYVLLSTDSGATFTTIGNYETTPNGWAQDSISFSATSPKTILRFHAVGDEGTSDIGLDAVQVKTLPICSDKPVAGTINTSYSSCGSSIGDTLFLQGNTSELTVNGISYQWQQSVDNVTWNTITGDTSGGVFVSALTPTYYRAIVTCSGSGLSDTTPSEQIKSIVSFYRTIPYTQNFESWMNNCAILDVPDTGWINIPSIGNNSWRRDDQGASANWTLGSFEVYSPVAAIGNHSARFNTSNLDYNDNVSGALNLYVNCSTPGAKQLSFYYLNMCHYNAYGCNVMRVYLSTDGGKTFGSPILTVTSPIDINNWVYYAIPLLSDSPRTVISFVDSTGTNCGYESMGLDYVQVLPACQSKPVAGNIVLHTNCQSDSLFLLGSTQAAELAYTWQQSTDSINWSNLSAPDTTINIALLFPYTTTYYRAVVTCLNTALSDTTAAIKIAGRKTLYSIIPYTQDFESWMNYCSNLDIPDTSWINTPSTNDSSWRRDDQGNTAGWECPTSCGMYTPASYSGLHSARFHQYGNRDNGILDLFVNCSAQIGQKELSFYYINQGNSGHLEVYISTDGGVTFGSPIIKCDSLNGTWTNYAALFSSNSAQTIIRFDAISSDNYFNDIGLDYVQVLPPCNDKPTAGYIVSGLSCSSINDDSLELSGYSINPGLSFAWQQSNDDKTWSTITGDTTTGADASALIPGYYRAIVTCKGSGLSDTTSNIYIKGTSSFYRSIPYTQDFESWMNRCAILDVPDTGWVNIPPTGASSWRRNDQGPSAHWFTEGYNYRPPSYSGKHSACFNDWDATTGILDLYVNCSTMNGPKQLTFYYNNNSSTGKTNGNYLDVYISTDGGNTFGSSLVHCDTASAWTQFLTPIVSDSPRTIIRFQSTHHGQGQIGLDLVQVLHPCNDKPYAGNVFANPAVICHSNTSTISIGGGDIGVTYQWQSSPDSINWLNLTGDTSISFTTPVLNASTYYRCVVTCIQSGLNDTSGKVYLEYKNSCLPAYCSPQSTTEIGDNIGNVTIDHGTTTILNNGIDSPAINSTLATTGKYYINYVDSPNLEVNLTQGYTYNISTAAITNVFGGNYPDSAYVYIDYNQDGIFEPNERAFSSAYSMPYNNTPQPVSGTFTVPLTADTGLIEMRVQLSYKSTVDTDCYNGNNLGGETEDYLVHIGPPPPCSGVPSAGNAEPAFDTLCSGASVNLYLSGASAATGLSYQWQSSNDNSTWLNLPVTTNQYNASGITSSIYYRCLVTCQNTQQTVYSTSAFVYIANTPSAPTGINDTICGPGTALLQAFPSTGSGSSYFNWFTSTADSLPVSSGSVYSPYVVGDTTFYVSCATSSSAYCTAGFDSISGGSFSYPGCTTFNSSGQLSVIDTGLAGLVFNTQTDITLTGVFIFPQYSGTFYIYLLNSSGVKLDSVLATVSNPEFPKPYWVPLNLSVPVGVGYQLVARISDVNCMANSDSRYAFPFTDCNNSIYITGGTMDGVKNFNYYFFYKWVINQGCESAKIPVSVHVKTPPALSITATNNGNSCSGQTYNGTLTANGNSYTSFTWSPVTGLSSLSGSSVSVSTPANTTYTVTATNGTCNNIATTTITIEPSIVIDQINVASNYNCPGEPVQITSSYSVLQPEVNYCLPTLSGDCNEYMSDFNFDNISINNSSCKGYLNHADTAFVQAGNSYKISITPNQNSKSYGFGVWIDYNQNGVFTDSSELVFVVPNQIFSGGQAETGTITIPQNAQRGYTRMRVINFLNNTPDLYSSDCNLESLEGSNQTNIGNIDDFTVDIINTSLSYNWSPTTGLSSTSILNPVATPSVSTTYTLTVTDSINECSSSDSVQIYVNSVPIVNIYASKDSLCFGEIDTLDAGSGFVSYLWGNGDTTQKIIIDSAGKYSVRVISQNGCAGTDTISIAICTGIRQINNAGNYSIGVYPNPFDNQFTLQLNGLPEGKFIFDMTNTLGQEVLEFKDQNTKALYTKNIDLHELPAGMYNISILLNGKNYIKQIIKTN